MSGRSAYVRQKNNPTAQPGVRQPATFKQYSDFAPDDPYIYGYTGPQAHSTTSHQPQAHPPHGITRPIMSGNASFVTHPPPHIRRRSQSSSGSGYSYPNAPHLHKPRPIVIASAIEKSDFRTHLDGMSSTLRGKLGGFMKGGAGKKGETLGPMIGPSPADRNFNAARRRPDTAIPPESEFEFQSRSTELTAPSVGAVPSLTASSGLSERPDLLSNQSQSYVIPTRSRQPQESVIHKIRKFEGGGKLPQLGWKSLSNNPELWDEHGDTFVYMYMRGSKTKPPPSFRIDSHVIFESGATAFIDQLHNICEPDGWPRFIPNIDHDMEDAEDGEEEVYYPSDPYDAIHSSTGVRSEAGDSGVMRRGNGRAPVPGTKAPTGIRYELYVPWPGAETGVHSTIWHITTRNYFAVMYGANALVGTTLLEAIMKLSERIALYPDYLAKDVSKMAWLTDYIVRHRFDDVRNNPSYAASLLAFSEMPDVQWRDGYIEAFVHCVGMLDLGLQTIPEWRLITPHTKMYLSNASMEIDERLHAAQHWLLTFDFTEMWPNTISTQSQPRACFERLRKWFCKYYENAFLHWPPTNDATWLTRELVVRLANDFHGLYDYLVDRDIIFDGTEYRPGAKWAITSASGQAFRADSFELPFTDLILGFDNRHEFPHMPHPYPITPPSVPVASRPKAGFTLKKAPTGSDQVAQTRRKALSYAEASNVYTLRDQYMHTDLVTNFIRFEQSDQVEGIDPYEARRGRWLLIYGVLQVLATISVDSPNLRYKEGAAYHLCPQMKGVVPWAERGAPPEEEAEHTRSHCWLAPATWAPIVPKARAGAHKPILWGHFGDGRSRGDGSEVAAAVETKVASPKAPAAIVLGTTTTTTTVATDEGPMNSRKRAEDWINSTPTVGDLTSENGRTMASSPSDENGRTSGSHGENPLIPANASRRSPSATAGVGSPDFDNSGAAPGTATSTTITAGDGSAQDSDARRRRALVHGFTDFVTPKEW